MANKIQIRRDTTANWTASNPILSQGELGLDTTLNKMKIGNGTSHWSALGFFVGDIGPQGPAGDSHLSELVNGTAVVSLDANGDLILADNGGIVFDRNNTSIRVGMGFHIASGEGISLEAIDNTDPDNLITQGWYFSPTGSLTVPAYDGSQLFIQGGEIGSAEAGNAIAISGNAADVVINTYNPTLHTWRFGLDGKLTLPTNSLIVSETSSVMSVGAGLADLETAYTDQLEMLHLAFTENSSVSGYPWGVTLPVSAPLTHEELTALSPSLNIPSINAIVARAQSTNLAYTAWRDAAAATNILVNVSNKSWTFGNDGGITFPTLSVDIHNGGVQTAQVLKFNDANKQVIITGPTPAAGNSAERIIIQGQRATGNGEGGDVYLWGGDSAVNGGDIKIYAGDGEASPSNGGYVNIAGGNGYAYGGDVTLTAGYASQFGGNVVLSAGNAGGQGGVAGQVTINASNHSWTFGNDGKIHLPASGDVVNSDGNSVLDGTDIYKFAYGIIGTKDNPDTGNWGGYNISLDPGGESYAGIGIPSVNLQNSGGSLYIYNNKSILNNIQLSVTNGTFAVNGNGTISFPGNKLKPTSALIVETTTGVPMSVTKTSSNQGWGSGTGLGTNLPTTGGSGTGLTVNVADTGSAYAGITIHTPGSGYLDGETLTVTNQGMSDNFTVTVPKTSWTYGTDGKLTLPNGSELRPSTTSYNQALAGWEFIRGGYITETINNALATAEGWPMVNWYPTNATAQGYLDFLSNAWTIQNEGGQPLVISPAISQQLHTEMQSALINIRDTYNLNDSGVSLSTGYNKSWTFGSNGTLTLPADIASHSWIEPAGNTLSLYKRTGNASSHVTQTANQWQSIVQDRDTGNWPAYAAIYAELPTIDTPAISISARQGTSGNISQWVFGADGKLVLPEVGTLSNTGYDWTFGTDGILTLPASYTSNPGMINSQAGIQLNKVYASGYQKSILELGNSVGITTGLTDELSGGSAKKTWQFWDDGRLTFPDNTVQTTAFHDVASNVFFVDPSRSGGTYTRTGTFTSPYNSITAAFDAAVAAGFDDSYIATVILLNNVAENITLRPGIFLTSLGTGTHGSPLIGGTVTVSSSTGTTVSNHYSISNLRIAAEGNNHCIDFIGTAPQKLFMRDIWLDISGTGNGIHVNNAGTGSTVQIDIGHLAHSGSGDVYCINVVHGNCYVTDIETTGTTQVAAVRSGCTLTFNGCELDANGDIVCETYGTGTLTITNCLITNAKANSTGILINDAGGTVTLGNNVISVPVGTGYAVQGPAGGAVLHANNVFTANADRSAALGPGFVSLPTVWQTK